MTATPLTALKDQRVADARKGVSPTDRQISENVHTLMRREGMSQRGLCIALEMSHPTLNRRLNCDSAWHFVEVQLASLLFGVTLDEITTSLPTREEWEARRSEYTPSDSNREPSDYTFVRPVRHLWAVA